MSKPEAKGASKRDHLKQVEKVTGKKPEGLKGPSRPALLDKYWHWFTELSPKRGVDQNGGSMPLTYVEIEAWARLTERNLSGFDTRVIMQMDAAFMRASRG